MLPQVRETNIVPEPFTNRMRVSFVDPKAWNYMIYILYLYYTVFRSRIIRECSPSGQRPLVDGLPNQSNMPRRWIARY